MKYLCFDNREIGRIYGIQINGGLLFKRNGDIYCVFVPPNADILGYEVGLLRNELGRWEFQSDEFHDMKLLVSLIPREHYLKALLLNNHVAHYLREKVLNDS